jgi:transposase-like protein
MALDKGTIADLLEALRHPQAVPQRLPRPAVVDQGQRCRAQDPRAARGRVLPGAAGAPRRIDRALLAVATEAYVHRTSTRKVDDLVKVLGVDSGISKSIVSRI